MALTYLDLILIIISLVTTKQLVNSEELGGRYSGEKIVSKASSPHQVSSDLVVLPESSVVIEPGTELRFDPGVKLLVHGTLTAVVSFSFFAFSDILPYNKNNYCYSISL